MVSAISSLQETRRFLCPVQGMKKSMKLQKNIASTYAADMRLSGMSNAAVRKLRKVILLAKKVLKNNLTKGVTKVSYLVSIYDRVDHRVKMRQDDGYIHDPPRLSFVELRVKEGDAVQDVDGQPAKSKETHNDGQ